MRAPEVLYLTPMSRRSPRTVFRSATPSRPSSPPLFHPLSVIPLAVLTAACVATGFEDPTASSAEDIVPLVAPPPEPRPSRLTVIPGLKISPEIGIGFGTMAVHSGWPRPGSRMEYRFIYTTRNQSEVRVSNRLDDAFGTRAEVTFEGSFQRFPDTYFGGGNAPRDADEVEYTPVGGYVLAQFLRPLGAGPFKAYGGLRAERWSVSDIRRVGPGGGNPADVLGPQVTGHDGGYTDVAEAGLEYDTRDHRDVPVRGLHAVQRVGTTLAGPHAYRSSESWLSAHETLGRRVEVAGKLWTKTLYGDPPFWVQPNLGNEDVLRGVPNKRFRDNSAQSATAEVRYNFALALPFIKSWLGKDWQLAAFAETGRVGRTFVDASRASLNHSAGIGGRLIFNERVGAMRGDLGFSEHGVALIVKFNQAF